MVAMVKFTADIGAIVQQAILSFVATVNADGTPNLSPKASLTMRYRNLYSDVSSITPLLSPAHVFADPPRSQDEIVASYRHKYSVSPTGP